MTEKETAGVESSESTEPLSPSGKTVLGVEFAPLNVPFERRIQTLAVAIWVHQPLLLGPLSFLFFLYLFFYTSYGFFSVVYLTFFLFDKDTCNRGGRRSNWFRKLTIWKHYCNYFPIRLIKTTELDPKKNYLFGSHPHGVLCGGAFGAFGTEGLQFSKVFPGLTPHLLTLDGQFSWPIYRDYLMLTGLCSASRESINHILTRPEGGHAAILVPGGAPEALDAHPGPVTRVHVNRRKGFIKMAIRNGASLVPVYSFGETEIFSQIPNPDGSKLRKFQEAFMKTLGVAPAFVIGRGIFQYTFGLVPRRHPIHVVVGPPIETVQMSSPTQEAIDEVHKRYADALMELFNKYKGIYGHKDDTLIYI